MSDVAAYHVFVCALFPVQGGMWTELPAMGTTISAFVGVQYSEKLQNARCNNKDTTSGSSNGVVLHFLQKGILNTSVLLLVRGQKKNFNTFM